MCFAKHLYEEREGDVRLRGVSRSDDLLRSFVVGNFLSGLCAWTLRRTGLWSFAGITVVGNADAVTMIQKKKEQLGASAFCWYLFLQQ